MSRPAGFSPLRNTQIKKIKEVNVLKRVSLKELPKQPQTSNNCFLPVNHTLITTYQNKLKQTTPAAAAAALGWMDPAKKTTHQHTASLLLLY